MKDYKGHIINEAVRHTEDLGVGDWVFLYRRNSTLKCQVKRLTKRHIIVGDAKGQEHKFTRCGQQVGGDEYHGDIIVPLNEENIDSFRQGVWQNKVIAKLDAIKTSPNLSGDKWQAIYKALEALDLTPDVTPTIPKDW